MLRRRGATVALVLVAALAFGVSMSVIHGSTGGMRAAVGNLSAPWVLLAFVAGGILGKRGIVRGAAAGLLVTALALFSFYLANIYVLGLTGHGPFGDVRVALGSGAYYFRFGAFSGPAMGALGAVWRRGRSLSVALVAVSLLLFEPVAWLLYFHGQVPVDFAPVALVEAAVGVVAVCAVFLWGRRSLPA